MLYNKGSCDITVMNKDFFSLKNVTVQKEFNHPVLCGLLQAKQGRSLPFLSAILLTSLWKGNLGIAAVGCFMNRLISRRTEECSANRLSLGCTLDNREGLSCFLDLEALRLTILFPLEEGPALSFGLAVCLT